MINLVLFAFVLGVSPFLYGEECGTTTLDFQNPGSQGNRIMVDDNGYIHLCWTYSEAYELTFPDMAVYYNVWDAAADDFVFPVGTKVSGSNRAGFCTMGLLSDGRAVIAFNEKRAGEDVAVVTVDVVSGVGTFLSPVVIDDQSAFFQPLFPQLVVDDMDIIHVVGISVDSADLSHSRIYYSRLTDEGQKFSTWRLISTTARSAVLANWLDEKTAIAWIESVNNGKAPVGHVKFVETIDGGATWTEPVCITQYRYPADLPLDETYYLFAHNSDLDIVYDNDGNPHILFCEWNITHPSADEWIPLHRQWSRVVHWDTETGFNIASGPYPMFPSGDVSLDSLKMWGVSDFIHQPYGGCWHPQLVVTPDDGFVATWCGQWDSLDLSCAFTTNADIYASGSYSRKRWGAVQDFYLPPEDDWQYYFTNITETHSYGGGVGACDSEEWLSVYPATIRDGYSDTVIMTYLNDLFPHSCIGSEECPSTGIIIPNPVCFGATDIFIWEPSVEENEIPEFNLELSTEPIVSRRTAFRFSAPLPQPGELRIHNVLGQMVRKFELPTGTASITWDGLDAAGKSMSNGVYFVELRNGQAKAHGRVTIIK
jgi:hypothetical protein